MNDHTPAVNGQPPVIGAVLETFNTEAENRARQAAVAEKVAERARQDIARMLADEARDADQLTAFERQAAELRRAIAARRETLQATQADEMRASTDAARLKAEADYMCTIVARERQRATAEADPATVTVFDTKPQALPAPEGGAA